MLDRRAWILTSLIVVLSVGAYALWLTRARAVRYSRSLSAPPAKKADAKTGSLHVEGCSEDFIVQRGELVEPRVVPGASVEQFRSVYGPESKKEARRPEPRVLVWNRDEFTLTEGNFGTGNAQNFVQVSLNQGHVLETLDGIELGIDSFGTIFRKMRDRKIEVHERMVQSGAGEDSKWTLIVSFYSACGRRFRSEYSRTLPSTPELDAQIRPSAGTGSFRSDVFLNKVIYEYDMVPANGADEAGEGQPSQHE